MAQLLKHRQSDSVQQQDTIAMVIDTLCVGSEKPYYTENTG